MAKFVCACCREDSDGKQYGAVVRGAGSIDSLKYTLAQQGALVRLFPICEGCAQDIANTVLAMRTLPPPRV